MKVILNKIELRGNDPTGHGYYGAKRGNKKHKGLDLVAEPLTEVYSPIDGVITKLGFVYKGNTNFRYVEITSDVYRVRIMYCQPKAIAVGRRIFEGDKIGEVQDIAGHWNSKMKNHIHLEVYKHDLLTDPEPLLINQCKC